MSNDPQNPYQAGGSVAAPTAPVGFTRKYTLRRLDVLSVGKLGAVMYAIFGILYGLAVGFFMAIGAVVNGDAQGAAVSAGVGLGVLVFAPFMFAVMGFIGGIIVALIYNLTAKLFGGVEFDLEG